MYSEFDIQSIYYSISIVSAVTCMMLGVLLLLTHSYKPIDNNIPIHPRRYIAARNALGIAYIIIGVLSFLQTLFNIEPAPDETKFFPLVGLVIATSQALLFTAASLALFNSKTVNWLVIFCNILPIVIILILYFAFTGQDLVQLAVRFVLFLFYIIQLVAYTIVFFIERRKYLLQVEAYFDFGKLYDIYKCRGLTTLFLLSLGIGIWALASFFFTTITQKLYYLVGYTLFYILVAAYYLRYSQLSQRIYDITTPEAWKSTEKFKHKFVRKERKLKSDEEISK